jgi:hypothetical protein
MGANERVILIKGDAGKWYNQAIFIINKDLPPGKIPVDFVAEAEKNITNYLQRKNQPAPQYCQTGFPSTYKAIPSKALKTVKKPDRKKFDFFVNLCMVLGCVMIVAALTFGLMN